MILQQSNIEIYYFLGFGTFLSLLFFRVGQFGQVFFWGMSFLIGMFWGVRFQNNAFCNVFLMYSLTKCSMFTISAIMQAISLNQLLSYKFNNLVAYFCQHH